MDIRSRLLGKRSPVTVEQGQVPVEMVRTTSRSWRHRSWEITFHSKYPEYLGGGGDTLMFHAGEHTMKCDRELLPTRVTLPIPRGWEVICDMYGKWSINVVAYRPYKRRYGVQFTDWETGKQPRFNRHGNRCAVCNDELALVMDETPNMVQDEYGNRYIHVNPEHDGHVPVDGGKP